MLSTPLRFLSVLPVELNLATVLKSGQSFRWLRLDAIHATAPDSAPDSPTAEKPMGGEEWAMGWGDRTVVLRQDRECSYGSRGTLTDLGSSCAVTSAGLGIHYRSLYPHSPASIAALGADLKSDTTGALLQHYFALDTKLAPLYARWRATDPHFAKKLAEDGGARLEGIRVLQQDPWETLIRCVPPGHL
mgnify:FL=1